jgi:hypothetical protein
MRVFNWNDTLNYGKFKGKTVGEIYAESPNYIYWSLQKLDWFCLTNNAFNNLPIIKEFQEAEMRFNVFGNKEDEIIVKENQKYFDHLMKIHDSKIEQLDENIDPNDGKWLDYDYQEPNYRDFDDSNWLADASGTNDPETMNDVYWNLD